MSSQLRKICVAAAVTAALTCSSGVAASAATDPPPPPPPPPAGPSVSVEVSPPGIAPSAESGGVESAAACNRYNRTRLCTESKWTLTVLLNGRPVGFAAGTIVQILTLNAKRRDFAERFNMRTAVVTGQAAGFRVMPSVSCGRGCTARSGIPRGRPIVVGGSIAGPISYTSHVARGVKAFTTSRYSLLFVKPGSIPGRVNWKSLEYRCDDTLSGIGAGCVFPRFAPTVSMQGLTFIAAGIRRILAGSPNKYGKPGSGHPLTRTDSEARRRANYNAVCRGQRPPTTLPPGWPPGQRPSCDEYPFASSYQGGTALSPRDRGITWVPVSEQNSQGARVKNFYYGNRVLDKDAFWVAA